MMNIFGGKKNATQEDRASSAIANAWKGKNVKDKQEFSP